MLTIEGKALALKTLEAMKKLFDDPCRWGRGEEAITSSGERVPPTANNATCFCIVGGLKNVCNEDPVALDVTAWALFLVMDSEVKASPERGRPPLYSTERALQLLMEWNDGMADYDGVLSLIDDAIAETKQGDLF